MNIIRNNYEILPGGVVCLELTRGKKCVIDLQDLSLIREYRWYALKAGRQEKFYAATTLQCEGGLRANLMLHHLLLGQPERGKEIDHINGDSLDCRRANMRWATRGQNMANRVAFRNNKCGYKGVNWYPKLGKWVASIRYEKKKYHLGYFANIEDAARAYNEAARRFHGEFAVINRLPMEDN